MIEHHDESFQRLVLSGGLHVEPDEFGQVLKITGLMTAEDTAKRFRTTASHLTPLIDLGKLKPVRHGDRVYFKAVDVERIKAESDGERNRRRLGTITR